MATYIKITYNNFKVRKKCADYAWWGYECAGYPAGCGKDYREPRRGTYWWDRSADRPYAPAGEFPRADFVSEYG